MKKLTTEEFIKKAKEIHGDRYGYSESVYLNNKTKLKISCKEHGNFEQAPTNHLRGQGCQKCSHHISTNEKAILYFVKCFNEDEEFFKIGITSNIERRFGEISYKIEQIKVLENKTGIIQEHEKILLKYIKNNNLQYKPRLDFKGSKKECFVFKYDNCASQILDYFRNFENIQTISP